jgi:hypothetical protein
MLDPTLAWFSKGGRHSISTCGLGNCLSLHGTPPRHLPHLGSSRNRLGTARVRPLSGVPTRVIVVTSTFHLTACTWMIPLGLRHATGASLRRRTATSHVLTPVPTLSGRMHHASTCFLRPPCRIMRRIPVLHSPCNFSVATPPNLLLPFCKTKFRPSGNLKEAIES